jgi:uncharacterized protein
MRAPIDGSVALVTGASSGIGADLARQLAPRVKTLILVARRRERLEALADEIARDGLTVTIEACDLTDRGAVDGMVDRVQLEHGMVDVLINNAGFGDIGMFDLSDWDKTERMIELNVRALAYLTHRVVGPMVEKGRGGILMISSGFGLTFLPGFAAYVGTKQFVTGFTESLRLELKPCGVVVTQVCPGPVTTEFDDNLGNFTGQEVPGFVAIDPARCARDALRGFERGKALVIPGVLMRMAMAMTSRVPRFMLRWVHTPGGKWLRGKQMKTLGQG